MLAQGEKRKHSFELTNVGKRGLRLISARSSCTCT
ncbi:MAG: DUF1573 domain-containing protein, partial [Pirellulales bacterium]